MRLTLKNAESWGGSRSSQSTKTFTPQRHRGHQAKKRQGNWGASDLGNPLYGFSPDTTLSAAFGALEDFSTAVVQANCFGKRAPGALASARTSEKISWLRQLRATPTCFRDARIEADPMRRPGAEKNRCQLLGQHCLNRPEWSQGIAERMRRRALRRRDPHYQVAKATYRAKS